MNSYNKNKKAILKYQKHNPYYREYRRVYEKGYREENRETVNFNSWKSMRKAKGLPVTPNQERVYKLTRSKNEQ